MKAQITAYVRKNDMSTTDAPAKYRRVWFYASQSKNKNRGNMGGFYFHKDGTWQGTALADGSWKSKSVLIAALKRFGYAVVDETEQTR